MQSYGGPASKLKLSLSEEEALDELWDVLKPQLSDQEWLNLPHNGTARRSPGRVASANSAYRLKQLHEQVLAARVIVMKKNNPAAAAAAPASAVHPPNRALENVALRLALLERDRYPLLKVSRRLQRLQVQQDALLQWYVRNKEMGDELCGPTEDKFDWGIEERARFEMRDSNGLIGVFTKQPIPKGTELQYPGVVMTREMHNKFGRQFYCPTPVEFQLNEKKRFLYGFPCRMGPMINSVSQHQIPNCEIVLVKTLKKGDPVPSTQVRFRTLKSLVENEELLCSYSDDFFTVAKGANRSCDQCAMRWTEAANFVECVEENCMFGRHMVCFSEHEASAARVLPFHCLDHEAHTMGKNQMDAVRMLQYHKAFEDPKPVVVQFNPLHHLDKLKTQQTLLDRMADHLGISTWSYIQAPVFCVENFEIRPSQQCPGTLGVFAKVAISEERFPGCLAEIGESVPQQYRIPYNGLVVSVADDKKRIERIINCPTLLPFAEKFDLFGNPADLGPLVNSVDMEGDPDRSFVDDQIKRLKDKSPKSYRTNNRSVNCEFSHAEDYADGQRHLFVQIYKTIAADEELIVDYGGSFWVNFKRSRPHCSVCQLKADENDRKSASIPAVFNVPGRSLEMIRCAQFRSCKFNNAIHRGCMTPAQLALKKWYCDAHAKSPSQPSVEAVEEQQEEEEKGDEHDSEMQPAMAPTSAASASAFAAAPKAKDDDPIDLISDEEDLEIPATPQAEEDGLQAMTDGQARLARKLAFLHI